MRNRHFALFGRVFELVVVTYSSHMNPAVSLNNSDQFTTASHTNFHQPGQYI